MNEKLKFAFGHVIAFLSLIFISYISFMGITYWSDGNFNMAAIGAAVIFIVLSFLFIKAQRIKGTDRKFRERIISERFWLFVLVVACMLAFIPFSHFWTVLNKKADVTGQFSRAIMSSKDMFTDYENYSNQRIDEYKRTLRRSSFSDIQKQNRTDALKLQLLSSNYDSLKNNALAWIDKSSDGASVWNIFLIGNIKQIKETITNWNGDLIKVSEKRLSTESQRQPFGMVSKSVSENLDSMNSLYTTPHFPNIWAFIIGLGCFSLLFVPYLVQTRNTKSLYTLFGKKEIIHIGTTLDNDDQEQSKDGTFTL